MYMFVRVPWCVHVPILAGVCPSLLTRLSRSVKQAETIGPFASSHTHVHRWSVTDTKDGESE
jgi:hypothetical protein